MANDTATLRAYVSAALMDASNATWSTANIDLLVGRSIASLYPRVQRPLIPASYTTTLVTLTYFYNISADIRSVSRLDLVDSDLNELGPLTPGTWEIAGDIRAGSGKLHLDPSIVEAWVGGTVRYNGYGRYDGTTNLIPDDYVAYVVAHARAAAFEWLTADRVRFRQYLGADQTTNTSSNELYQLVSSAKRDVAEERSMIMTMRKPMPARI